MYKHYPTIVFGFHACNRDVGEELVSGKASFKISKNKYDWLGEGMYFWENSPYRAKLYGEDLKQQGKIEEPAVVGAAINLGYCLDLLDSEQIDLLRSAYDVLNATLKKAGVGMLPENKAGRIIIAPGDLLLRKRDCAVINFLHTQREEQKLREFDSVRGVFWEGEPIYPTAGFNEKNHIQIAVRNPNCIKGYFWPLTENSRHPLV